MDEVKEMILADALDVAIKQAKKIIFMRRVVIGLTVISAGLIVAHIVR